MKRGDNWNWAYVTSAVLILCVHLFMLHYKITTESCGRHVNKMAYGFSGILIPLWIAPILLVISGCLSLYLKSKTPIAGTAIGIGLYFPLMVASLIVGAIAMSIIDLPSQSGVFILPIGLLIWAFMRNPKDNQERFPQHPPPPPRSPAERSKGEG